jgi:hypothetical protein
MGDYADIRDIDRFLRCDGGRRRLDEIRAAFVGKTVAKVMFTNDVDSVLVTLTFDSGENVELFLPELMLDALREIFHADIQEEYFKDYPERRPNQEKGSDNDGKDES